MGVRAVEEAPLQVVLVPVLASEGWRSIDLYRDDLIRAFAHIRDEAAAELLPMEFAASRGWLGRKFDFHLRLPRRLQRHLAQARESPIIHVLDQNYAPLCRAARRSVVTCHDLAPLRLATTPAPRRLSYFFRVTHLKHADAVVCVSNNTARDVAELLGVDANRIHVNPPGVHGAFRPLGRRREGKPLTLLHVGSNDARKNLPVLLKALARLRKRVPRARLVKVGPPLARSGLAGLIRSLELEDSVLDLGSVDLSRLVEIYNAVDAMVLPSLYEGFGRPVLEAQACGTPCVLAASSALPETGGNAALYHDPADDEALAAQLEVLAMDSALRRRLIVAGFRNVARFSWAEHARKLVEIYRTVLAAST